MIGQLCGLDRAQDASAMGDARSGREAEAGPSPPSPLAAPSPATAGGRESGAGVNGQRPGNEAAEGT